MLWKCQNPKCADNPGGAPGHVFEADLPVCPKCGVDGRDPAMAHVMLRVALIHFDPPHPAIEGYGRGHPACDPKRKIHDLFQTYEQATRVPDVVNCAKCRASEFWPADWKPPEQRLPPHYSSCC